MRALLLAVLLLAAPVHAARFAEIDEAGVAVIAACLPATPQGIGPICADHNPIERTAADLMGEADDAGQIIFCKKTTDYSLTY